MKFVEMHIGDILSNGAGARVLWRLDSPAPTGRARARAACTPACMEQGGGPGGRRQSALPGS